jgi:hypothetical protein
MIATLCLCFMSGEAIGEKKAELALAVASGHSVADWARINDVALRTAYRWYSDPEVHRAVEFYRRVKLDMALGRFAARSPWAADGIAGLAESAVSETVRLNALRAILFDQMKVSQFSALELRLAQVEDKLLRRDAVRLTCGGESASEGESESTSASTSTVMALLLETLSDGEPAGSADRAG